jgi:ABC-type dipeptide/oligopeptide/nickel transport system ATPase component
MILYQEKKIEAGNLKMKIVKKKLHTYTHTLSLCFYAPKNKTKTKDYQAHHGGHCLRTMGNIG